MRSVHTMHAPKAIGPYSQAILHNGMLFISGQIGINPQTGEMGSNFTDQTRHCFTNLREILREAGLSFSKVVKVTVYLTDLTHFDTLNEIYGQHFSDPYPARETVQVAALPRNAHIEISLVAMA